MSEPTLWCVAPDGKPINKGSILIDGDIHLWGWSAALFGWCVQGGSATPSEIERGARGLNYLARRMRESVRFASPLRCAVPQ